MPEDNDICYNAFNKTEGVFILEIPLECIILGEVLTLFMTELNKTVFSSLKECLNPDNGKSIIIPSGFGIKEELEKIRIENKDDIKCPILKCMYKDNYKLFNANGKVNLKYFQLYEKYLYFISNIYKSYLYNKNTYKSSLKSDTISYGGIHLFEDEPPITIFFSMKSDSKTGLISNSLGMDKGSITKMVNFMIRYKFIELYKEEHSFIDYSKGENISYRKCREYIVSPQFFRSPVKYFFKNNNIIEAVREQVDRDLQDVLDNADETINFESIILSDGMIKSYTFPTIEKLYKVAEKMVMDGRKDKYGRIYSFGIPLEWMSEDNGKKITKKKADGSEFSYTIHGKLKPQCPFVDINTHIYNFLLMMNGPKTIRKRRKYVDKDGRIYYDRFYSFISNIPKWIRDEILIEGEPIKEIDAVALHSKIVGKLYSDYTKEEIPDFLSGDSHTKLGKILDISRQEAKIIGLSYWNSRILYGRTIASKRNAELFNKMDDFIKKDYPKLFEFLKKVKTTKAIKEGKSSNTNMSVLLIDKEVRIMQDFLNNFRGFSYIYVFDCVYVKEKLYEFAKKGFERTINKHLKNK